MNGVIIWSPGVTLEAIEEQVIGKAYAFYKQNKTATSNALGISIRTLDAKLEKYGNDERDRTKRDADRKQRDLSFLDRQRNGTKSNAIAQMPEETKCVPLPDAGIRMESSEEVSAEQPVPVSQLKEVQKVLPQQSTSGHPKRAR